MASTKDHPMTMEGVANCEPNRLYQPRDVSTAGALFSRSKGWGIRLAIGPNERGS